MLAAVMSKERSLRLGQESADGQETRLGEGLNPNDYLTLEGGW